MEKKWTRIDREDGRKTTHEEKEVRTRLHGYYRDVSLAMSSATEAAPVTTGYADYYPEEAVK